MYQLFFNSFGLFFFSYSTKCIWTNLADAEACAYIAMKIL